MLIIQYVLFTMFLVQIHTLSNKIVLICCIFINVQIEMQMNLFVTKVFNKFHHKCSYSVSFRPVV